VCFKSYELLHNNKFIAESADERIPPSVQDNMLKGRNATLPPLQCAGTCPPSTKPLLEGDLDSPRLIRDSMGLHESAPNGISIGSAVFTQLIHPPNAVGPRYV